ncbi:hypothetical protein, partial [Pseudomonas aeruginosa]|uniref:hypothetical protein n=1 Tax=Pseudomonas aeruginosa TaxID=287 RepID=UPI003CE804B9
TLRLQKLHELGWSREETAQIRAPVGIFPKARLVPRALWQRISGSLLSGASGVSDIKAAKSLVKT